MTESHIGFDSEEETGDCVLFQAVSVILHILSPLPPPLSFLPLEMVASADVNAVEVIGSEGGVALGAFPLPCVVARLHTLEAEDVEALGQYGILHSRVAAWAC